MTRCSAFYFVLIFHEHHEQLDNPLRQMLIANIELRNINFYDIEVIF